MHRILILGALAAGLQAQTFEVASVKPSEPGGRGMSISRAPGGRFTSENVPLRFLITFAYDVRDHQVTGGPGWLNTDRWDITAKAESEVPNTPEGAERMRTMVKALLAERFGLVIRRDSKEMPVYALVIGKNGPKLIPSTPEAKGPRLNMGRGKLTGTKVELAMLANTLANNLGRTVVDETGLKGPFDFTLEFLQEQEGPLGPKNPEAPKESSVESDLPSLFTAVQEQLGLKLESKRGPVEVLVIEKAEKATGN